MFDCRFGAYRLPDLRADEGVRTVRLTPHGIRIDRTVRGIKMRICIAAETYREILVTRDRQFCRLILAHDDPDLSVRLEEPNAEGFWPAWALVAGIAPAAPARRRRSATLTRRRPRILLRRRPGKPRIPAKILCAARELFSWE